MIALVSQDVVDPGSLEAAGLVRARLEVDQAEQAPALDLAGAALVAAGISVLMLHPVTVSTTLPSGKRCAP
jgi:hypothetical protein